MANPNFPASTWDGSSASRKPGLDHEPARQVYRQPDGADWEQITEEMIAVQNALATTMLIAAAGNTAVLATTATSGYAFIPRINGTPTGVPANVPQGFNAIGYDQVNKKICVYDAGWKSTAAMT